MDCNSVGFSPSGMCTTMCVDLCNSASTSIRAAGYAFNSYPIRDAIIAAHGRGVNVRMLFDYFTSNRQRPAANACLDAGIPIRLANQYPNYYNSFLLADDSTLLSGTFVWTYQAQDINACNLYRITDTNQVNCTAAQFDTDYNNAVTFVPTFPTQSNPAGTAR